ncbi:hypothetical protein MMC28_000500 [Mycoblastus sanguinarius]|nr:hypothetical protein [Mycoblastus sanguinarius]
MSTAQTCTRVTSQVRLHPEPRPSKVTETPLSVLDAAAAPFPPGNCTWFYNSPTNEQDAAALSVQQLSLTLQLTVNAYPQWAGQLQLNPYASAGKPKRRYGRLLLKHGSPNDPGVEFIVAESSLRLEEFLPSVQDRLSGHWDANQIPEDDFVSKTPFAMEDGSAYVGLPGIALQLTTFAGGGLAIAIKISRPLADAQSLVGFIRDWASINREVSAKRPPPKIDNIFDPLLLEKATLGDIDGLKPDPALIERSRKLPVHRYDRWAQSGTCPPEFRPALEMTKPPFQRGGPLAPAVPIPWPEWNYKEPSQYYHLYFEASEIHDIWESAAKQSEAPFSRLDAFIAHLWKCLSRARKLDPTETIYLNMILDIRKRLAPPLPSSFVGAPTVHVHTAMQGQGIALASTPSVAEQIRNTIAQFNPNTVPAFLHDMNHEAGPQRLWQFFLGRRHTTCMSWLRQGISRMEFAEGVMPRYVESSMPKATDGVLKIMEAPLFNRVGGSVNGERDTAAADAESKTREHWSDNGVIVSLVMNNEVMQRLLKDPVLKCGEMYSYSNGQP